MSFWDKVRLTTGPDRNVNNLKQPVNNISEMESPNDFRQTEMVELAQNPNFDPRAANNPVFDSLTEQYGEPTQNPDGTWSHSNINETEIPIEQTVSDYDQMINNIAAQYGTTPDILEDSMNRISFHETGPNQRYESGAIQEAPGGGQGPGRGLFQFEKTMKDNQGQYGQAAGLTARNRLAKWYTDNSFDVPDWLSQANMTDPTVGFDASLLSPEQQRMLFMGDIAMGKGGTFEGIENLPNWWSKYHHKGGGRIGDFEDSMKHYETPEEVEMKNNVVNPTYQQAF